MIGSVLAPSGRKLVDVPYVSEASRQEFHPNIDQKYEPPARNMLAVHFEEPFEDFDKDPDSLINGMMGVIKVINKVDPRANKDKYKLFSESDKKMLSTLPKIFALQLAHMRQEMRQSERLRDEQEMREGAVKLVKQDSFEGLAQAMFENITRKTECRALCLYTKSPRVVKGEAMYTRVTARANDTRPSDTDVLMDMVPVAPSFITTLFSNGNLLILSNCKRNPTYNPKVDRPLGINQIGGAILGVVIRHETSQEIIGIVALYDKSEDGLGQFNTSDAEYTIRVVSMLNKVVAMVQTQLIIKVDMEAQKERILALEEKLEQEKRNKQMREEAKRMREKEDLVKAKEEEERQHTEQRLSLEQLLNQQDIAEEKEKAAREAAEYAKMPFALHRELKDPKFVEALRALAQFCGCGKTEQKDHLAEPEALVRFLKHTMEEGGLDYVVPWQPT